jgi:1-acyl-sn-glycerol-3-phosphate acyltransferase
MKCILKCIIIIIIILIILITTIINTISNKTLINTILNILNTNITVKGIKNLKHYKNKKIIIMSNHYVGIDYLMIVHTINYYTNYSKNIHTIVKHNVFGDKNDGLTISNILALFKKDLYKFLNFLPYVRDLKDSGDEIKNKILDVLKHNDTVLLFPEGTGNKNGIPIEFKSGSFRLCADNNIHILPITIKLNKNIGASRTEKIDLKDWFNIKAEVIIHKPIFDNDWNRLKEMVFDKIREPFL